MLNEIDEIKSWFPRSFWIKIHNYMNQLLLSNFRGVKSGIKTSFKRPIGLCMKSVLLIAVCAFQQIVHGQSLTISSGGQTGTSGTNWSTSGSNPVEITVTGSANINTSVINGYLNSGTSVRVNNNNVGTTINNNITKTSGASASLTFRDIGFIKVAGNVNITSTSNALNLVLWADSDNSQSGTVTDFMFINPGVTVSSNGGKIVLAGGSDDGSNGGINGDGIPDGFAWNGSNSTNDNANQYGGLTLGPRGGYDAVISLLSNGGDIILRGATSNLNSYPGITSQANLRIESGTGRVIMFGKSSSGHGIELTYGATPSIAITSASSVVPAIDIKGTADAGTYQGFWASNNINGNILLQSTAAVGGGITIEGTNPGDYGISIGAANTNISTQLLSQSGDITLKGLGGNNASLQLFGDVYIGNRRDGTIIQGVTPTITNSTANIVFQANDQIAMSNASGKTTRINSAGSLRIEAYSNGFGGSLSWAGNPVFGNNFSSIILGESHENYNITVNNSLTSTGNIDAWSSDFTLNSGVGLTSIGAGNITLRANGNFGTAGTGRRTISSANGNISIIADADASGHGQLDIDYLTLNPGSGNIILRTETMSWSMGATDKPYLNGTGTVTIEPTDASFQDVYTSWFVFDQDANGMGGLRIGKPGNNGNIIHELNPVTVAGPIAFFGGTVGINTNLTSSATGDIFIKSTNNLSGGGSINNAANIFKTGGTGTLTMQSQARLNSGNIIASGAGTLNVVLWSDYGNQNNGGVDIRTVSTNGGHLWVGGSQSNGGSYTWKGLAVGDGPSVGSVNNNHNAMDFIGPVSTNGGEVLIWGGNGYGGGAPGIGVYPGAVINSGNGNVTLITNNISLNDLRLTTTGILTLVPDGGSFPGSFTWNGTISSGNLDMVAPYDRLIINNVSSLGGLTIGNYSGHQSSGGPVVMGNTSQVAIAIPISVAGPVSLYSPFLAIPASLTSTAAANISLYTNSLNVSAGVSLSSKGMLIIEPYTSGTTIGLAGGTGSLSLPTAYFTTNFTDGFAEIRIGNTAAGTITSNTAFTAKDHLRLITGGNLVLNETIEIGDNDLRFYGSNILPGTNKYVKTNGIGKLIMNVPNNFFRLFPIGLDHYAPVTITNHTGITDEFYATVSSNVYTSGSVDGTEVNWKSKVNQTWNIGNTAASTGGGNVDLSFGWNPSVVGGNILAPRLFHYESEWAELPGVPSFDLTAGTLSYTGYNGTFSPFSIAEFNALLPVTWLSFTGKRIQQGVELTWSTATEVNNSYFEIQRRTDGTEFTTIGRVSPAQSTLPVKKYHYLDLQISGTRSYYRLRQIDVDGKVSYSTVIVIHSTANTAYKVSSIPGSTQLMVTAPADLAQKAEVVVFDGNGRQLLNQKLQPGNNLITTNSLTAGGVYFIKITSANKLQFSGSFIY